MATSLKQRLVAAVIDREGGFIDHPSDRGGPTRYGITKAVARENGYSGSMKGFPRSLAVRIYEARYWHGLKLDKISAVSAPLAEYLFDYAVNSGPGRAAKELQRTLNVLNDRGRAFPDISADGAIGPATLDAIASFRKMRNGAGVHILAETINACRIAFCRGLAERTESQEDFAYGWFRRVVNLRSETASPECERNAVTLYSEIDTGGLA